MSAVPPAPPKATVAAGYHQRSKHRLGRYAPGPQTLDWSMQPDPFRRFAGCARMALPLAAEDLAVTYADMIGDLVPPRPLSLANLGLLLELSFGLAAWKQWGPDRWALRCNPSSGNLHPTEAYVIAQGVARLENGVYHYVAESHVLEQRFVPEEADATAKTGLWIGLNSIHWREAWKYGERAFRYCQLDTGHALGALGFAAAVLGWRLRLTGDDGATLTGASRLEDFLAAEAEEAEVLVEILAEGNDSRTRMPWEWDARSGKAAPGFWAGQANTLDPHPLYHWPVIDEVAQATRGGTDGSAEAWCPTRAPRREGTAASAARIILGRRSAQRFDPEHVMPKDAFLRLMAAILPRAAAPWTLWDFQPRLHPLLFVHRVSGLERGLYFLARRDGIADILRPRLDPAYLWRPALDLSADLPLYLLGRADCRRVARTLCCHQAIAGDSSFALAMLAEFDDIVGKNAWRYRQLHWEAGLIGQALYLEAEAVGLRGTGIGCFFDDEVHQLIGLSGASFQSLYHFTVGRPMEDGRISTLPAYPGRRNPILPPHPNPSPTGRCENLI